MRCVRHPKIVLKSSFLRCDMARYYGGICINHTVLKRISSKKIFRTVVLRSGGGAGGGCENRVATAFKTKYKQPIAHRLPSNTTTAARPSADLPPPPVGEGQDGVRLHTANAKSPAVLHSPPWERVGVGAAKKHAATQPHRTSSFTYTPSAQAYVNCPATP